MKVGAAAFLSVVAALAGPAVAGEVLRTPFGALPDGRQVEAIELVNTNGVRAKVITYGASLQSLTVPTNDGQAVDIVVGQATLRERLEKPQYFGSTVGRVANRIARGKFVLDGRAYSVPVNNGVNSLHGGAVGFDKALWKVVDVQHSPGGASVSLRHVSPHGDQGFPGRLEVTAVYRLSDDDALTVEYESVADRATAVNITNHTYWNVAGESSGRSALEAVLEIPAEQYLPVDDGLIPTGEIRSVAGTDFDFREPTIIADRVRNPDPQLRVGRGYDHNWIVARETSQELRLMARVKDPASGRGLEVWSNQPGLQFYSGNFLDGTTVGKGGRMIRQGDAIALEPQSFPDTVNQPAFGSARLGPGERYRNTIVFRVRR